MYGGEAPHQLSLLYLLREYRRNIGTAGFAAARRLLNAGSLVEAEGYAAQVLRETDRAAAYWCDKVL